MSTKKNLDLQREEWQKFKSSLPKDSKGRPVVPPGTIYCCAEPEFVGKMPTKFPRIVDQAGPLKPKKSRKSSWFARLCKLLRIGR